jgi:hypothetical protein
MVLQDQLKTLQHRPKPDLDALRQIQAALHKMKTTQLVFGIDRKIQPERAYSWNAQANPMTNECYLDGLILLVDSNPSSLFTSLLHELGHLVSPLAFSLMPDSHRQDGISITSLSPHYPFQKEIQCLQETVAKKRDDACIFKELDNMVSVRFGTPSPEFLKNIQELKSNLRANPYLNPLSLPELESCQMSQLEESYGDWFAGEGLALKLQKQNSFLSLAAKQKSAIENLGVFCEFYNFEGKYGSEETDSHLSAEKRLNEIFLRQPQIRDAIGCPAESEPTSPKKDTRPSKEFAAPYCGTRAGN